MIIWPDSVVYSIGGAMLLMMLIGIMLSVSMPALGKWNKRFFVILFSLLLLYVTVLYIDTGIYKDPTMATAETIVVFFEYLLFSGITFMPTFFLLHTCSESTKGSPLIRAVVVLWVAYCFMLIISQFTDVFYYTTPNNQFFRGKWFALMLAPLAAILILNTVGVIRRRKKLSKRVFIALLVYLLPVTVVVIVYMFGAFDPLISFVVVLCALALLGLILVNNIEQHVRQQREIANQRAGVLVLQMRPHFIYNTMMSIYYLCKQDADKAQQVTLDFTTYLRKNFTAIASDDAVPFKDELEHTRAYLDVEMAQHEDMLFVEYDTPHIHFRVPPLTLQPLVENAVKHCLNPNGDPLRIYVKTRLTDHGSEIIVENTGEGFKPSDNDEPHIALANIEQRLEFMCDGKMTIAPREGGGTIVRVIIPTQKDRKERIT